MLPVGTLPFLQESYPQFPNEETKAQTEPVGLEFRAAWLQRQVWPTDWSPAPAGLQRACHHPPHGGVLGGMELRYGIYLMI